MTVINNSGLIRFTFHMFCGQFCTLILADAGDKSPNIAHNIIIRRKAYTELMKELTIIKYKVTNFNLSIRSLELKSLLFKE